MKLTKEQVIFCREHYAPGDKEFGLRPLAEKFGVSIDAIKDLVHGKTYKDAGGKIHPAQTRLSKEVKAQLATTDDLQAIAERFGLSAEMLQKYAALLKPKKTKVTEEIKAAIIAEYEPYSKEYGREALAQKYGLSTATVGQIVKGLKRKERPTVPDFLKEAIIEAADEEKLSVKKLAERFSLSRDLVKSVLKEAGIELRTRQIVDEATKQEIIAAYKSGQSLRQLEEIYGINRATMSPWVKEFKPEKPKVELTQEVRERIYRYHSQGYGTGIIAKTIGISQKIVRQVIDGEL